MTSFTNHIVSAIAAAASVGSYVVGEVWATDRFDLVVCIIFSTVIGTLAGAFIFTNLKRN